MKLTFKFLEKVDWSMYGTLNAAIPFIIFLILKKVNLENLVFSSLMGMMDGDLIPKILFTGFMNFMVMKDNVDWIIQSFIFVLSVIITHYIPYNNPIHKFVYQNDIVKNLFVLIIGIWMIYILYLIYKKTKKIFSN